ncbi:hypothetical protein C8R46DRAFT_153853 [Mycena filopes]|nr:hypothetical protein C8R46DRAFT_153853 [Mycena filopes]
MRSQALIQRSRSLLRPSFSRAIAPRPSKTPTPRPVHAKRLASSASPAASEPPPLESPSDPPNAPASSPPPPDPPAEEPEKGKRKKSSSLLKETTPPPKEPEPPLELPQGLALEILWRPESDSGPSNQSALPPPEIFDEALHNLYITLHPQTQHRATYASPLGPLLEPTLALYCPIEGGEYVIDATVRELARRTDAEVLVLDSVQLAAGEWGSFGKAANSLQLPRNPLHFRSSPSSHSRPSMPDEDEDDMDGPSPFSPQMTLTLLNPPSGRAILASGSPRNKGPPSKIEVFFETIVNTPSPDEQSPLKPRPRLIYIRDFPTLAPSSSAWYPPLVDSVRSRRRRSLPQPTTAITHPVTIIFGMTPSLVPKPSSGPRASPVRRMTPQSQRVVAGSKQQETEWSEDEASERAREKRLRDRLRRWEKGDGLHDQLPKLSHTEEGGGENGLGFIIIGGSNPMMAQPNGSGDRDSNDADPLFFRTSVLVPTTRSVVDERTCRVTRRREINELTMRMGVGAIGGVVEKEAASAVISGTSQLGEEDAAAPPSELPPKKASRHSMWEDWGNRIELWSTVRAVADHAVGSAVAAQAAANSSGKRTLEATPVDWSAIDGAWAAHRAGRNIRKAWMKDVSSSSTSKSARETEEDEEESDSDSEPEEVDEVVDRLKEEDLDDHEQRLLSCIVNPATMPTSFSQVHLPAHTIDSIRTIVSLPLLHPQAFQQGILKEHSMTGCLLFGPPGTGKTLVVRALAKEAGCRMMAISPSDVMDMYVGEGEKLVKAVFTLARRIAPCVVFLDEIDALFGARVSGRDRGANFAHRGVLTEFMQEMDGLRSSKDDSVIVIGATNRPFDLDDAVLRRLPRRLLVDLPGEPEREAIIRILLRDETLGDDLDPKSIAQKTENFSGSDLKHLCVSAALDAVKEHVVVPWSSTSTPPAQESTDAETVSADDATAAESAETAGTTSPPLDGETASPSDTPDEVPPPAVAPRILYLRHFTKALKEITPSSSATLGTLADLKKWNEEFGEGRGKKRQHVWGQGRFGFTEKPNTLNDGRVVPAESGQG